MSPRFSRKYLWMTPLTISLDKFTRITSYPNLAPNFFLSVVSATSLKTQSSVSMATSTKKLTDAVWETLYLQSSQISSWQNWNPTLSDPLTHRFATGMLMIVLPKRKKTSLMIFLSASTVTILTSFLLSKKILDTSQVQLQSLQETRKTTNALEIRNPYQMQKKWYYWCRPQSETHFF